MKCLICHGPHRAADCPTRAAGGASGNNMNIGAVQEEAVACFISHWVEEDQLQPALGAPTTEREGAAMMVVDLPTELAYFCMEDLYGYTIIDTGATKSMAGLSQIQWIQDQVFSAMQEDPLELDNSVITTFTYVNGPRGKSLGKAGIPHPLALKSHGDCLWFTMVETPSPTLIGLDYLDAAGASPKANGMLEYADGHQEPMTRLRSGHWGIPLM